MSPPGLPLLLLLLRRGAAAALTVATLAGGALAADDAPGAGQAGRQAPACQLEKPASWSGGKTAWTGGCARSHADGLGVLENDVGSSSRELFAGYVSNGVLRRGVLVTEGGYVAGDWRNGAVVQEPGDDLAKRNVMIRAFETAADAADAASKTMARRSDAARSRFYSSLATRLRNQMD